MSTMPRNTTYPGIEKIAKAFENDPRTRLANTIMANGTSTAPVAGGSWAWVDGISRALQGALGGHITRKQMAKYADEESKVLEGGKSMAGAGLAALAPPAPATPQPAMPVTPAPMAAPQAAPQPAPGGLDPMAAAAALSPPPQAAQPPMERPQAAIAGMPIPGIPPMPPGMGTPGIRATPEQQRQAVAFTDPLGGKGGPVSSGFGPRKAPMSGASTRHSGIDIPAPSGTPVAAAAGGTVIAAWDDKKNGGGLSVRVRHPDGSITGYAHMSAIGVKPGDAVEPGQPIGAVGSTGRSTGNHLHFTLRDASGKRIDPSTLKYSDGAGSRQPASAPGGTDGLPVPPVALEGEVAVPEAMARPDAPEAEAATISPKLKQAYEMLQRGNKYEYDTAMKMMQEGLSEQGTYNESAAGRRQDTKDATYGADLRMYGDDRQTRVNDALSENRNVRERNWRTGERKDTQQYQTADREDTQAFAAAQARADRDFRASQARLDRDADFKRTVMQINASKATKEEKNAAKQDAYYRSPQGTKDMTEFNNALKTADANNTLLNEFLALNAETGTGGNFNKYTPDKVLGAISGNKERMIQITDQMAQSLTKTLPGALSNADLAFLRTVVPTVSNGYENNKKSAKYYQDAANRQSEYMQHYVQSRIDGDTNFPAKWREYVNTVPIQKAGTVKFEDFKAMRKVKM